MTKMRQSKVPTPRRPTRRRQWFVLALSLSACLLASPLLLSVIAAQTSSRLADDQRPVSLPSRESREALAREITAAMPASEDLAISASSAGCQLTITFDYSKFCERVPYTRRTVDRAFDVRELASTGPVLNTESQAAPDVDVLRWPYSRDVAEKVSEIVQEMLRNRRPGAQPGGEPSGRPADGEKSSGRQDFPPDASAVLDAAGIGSRALTTTCDGYQYASPEGGALTLLVVPGSGQSLLGRLRDFKSQCSTPFAN
jgi:hypothetical protein